ncbi:ECF RNA polymerase sigma factor SigM [Enhygromyxa salina]|uniref:ECF RNA polymerase sigma factor SigM n=1 Tax=Enhygromyxa salina TaxID=215803 RepID=A0A2S9YG97_9BACT|nr:RNA polymerase sigma factor [Enhygromyxa salina]PRQ04130.1 ECF RNA polymerase sigma factor SigM [Enhygromyxa salina]
MSAVTRARPLAPVRASREPSADAGAAAGDGASAELELMQRAAAGDREAQAAVVKRVILRVRARARSLTRSDADADDATQNSIVEILRSAGGYRGEGSLDGWCERIAIRTTLRQQRRQARHLALIDERVDPDQVPGRGALAARTSDPADVLEVLEIAENFVTELSDDRVQALTLRAHGHSVAEIAAQTGASRNTVKDRLRMARRQLRQSIRQREVVASVRRSTQ